MMPPIIGTDGLLRCHWCYSTPALLDYHDTEWGFAEWDDFKLFEKLCLEGFQSGLSWQTILSKRVHFRTAFLDFDFNKLAQWTEHDLKRLLQNKDIVRHRGKIAAVIHNAAKAQTITQEYGSLATFVWQYAPTITTTPHTASTSLATALTQALKSRDWKFVGPTTIYAFMQSTGMINDHVPSCVIRPIAEAALQHLRK